MSLGTGASGWWSLAMRSREGGIHGSPEAAATHPFGHRHTEGLSRILTNKPQDSQTYPREGGLGENCEACQRLC